MTQEGLRVLVCGGRRFDDRSRLFAFLDKLHAIREISLVIHGDAPGADRLGEAWAKHREVPYVGVPARWSTEDYKAGPLRNGRMLNDWQPSVVIAFPGGRGTADMMGKGRAAGVPVIDLESSQGVDSEWFRAIGTEPLRQADEACR